MAFIDASGDIILDAVLTDLGRRKMANGNFRITKFALGDDEINYSQYDVDHPSGSSLVRKSDEIMVWYWDAGKC